jgi:hypothetical protein
MPGCVTLPAIRRRVLSFEFEADRRVIEVLRSETHQRK